MTVGTSPLVDPYDALLFDLDGVLYVGGQPVEFAAEAVRECRDGLGKDIAFITNNASRTPESVAEELIKVGVEAHLDDVVTSAQAAARLLAQRFPAGSPILVVGGEGLVCALESEGLAPVWADADDPVAVVQGFHPDVNWRMLAQGAAALHRKVPWVATNRDMTIPTAFGICPGNGTLIAALQVATGREPTTVGKPEPPLVLEALRRTGATNPLIIGDRLDTDIQAASATGFDSLLVLTGVSGVLDYVQAVPSQRPTHLARDLRGLLAPTVAVERTEQTWSCDGWQVRYEGAGTIAIARRGDDALDAIRAIAAASWALTDAGEPVGQRCRTLVRELADPA